MKWIKTIFINVGVTFALVGTMLLAPPVIFATYDVLKGDSSSKTLEDPRGYLDLYEQYDWANAHFREFSRLPTQYYDYISWRRGDFSGETITIENGVRRTVGGSEYNPNERQFWFFGGSTTWGTGVSDEFTFPSMFARANNVKADNFGETGYIARQSLAYLINRVITHTEYRSLVNTHVVFYDGVNEVIGRCRAEIDGLGTARENQLRSILEGGNRPPKWSFRRTFAQVKDLLRSIRKQFRDNQQPASAGYNCADNQQRAYEVALTLVNTWDTASRIVTERSGRFTAVLQPVAYIGAAEVDYLALDSANDTALAAEYAAVYPLIQEIAASREFDFIDLSSAFDDCADCYIDFCHVGPQAHARLVENLASHFF